MIQTGLALVRQVVPMAGLLFMTMSVGFASELVTLDTRPDVQMKVLVLLPEAKPKGVLIAYAGGDGTLGLTTRLGKPVIGNSDYEQGFLIRNREQFVKAGYALLLPDVPSDREKLNYIYRLGLHQIDDASALVDFAKDRFGVAPWLMGISASSMTVASVGANPDLAVSGIVLMASVTTMPSSYGAFRTHPEGTASTKLSAVKVPALVLAHRDDACELSPPADSAKLMERLIGTPRKAERTFSGGSRPRSGPCFALSPHGFLGIEGEVERAVIDFIEKPGP